MKSLTWRHTNHSRISSSGSRSSTIATARYEFRNDLSFGGGGRTADYSRRRPTEVVRDVYVAIFGGITEDEIRQLLRITEGRHFDFYKWQRDRDRLQKLFVERGFFEARLTARRDPPAPSKPQPGQLAPVDLGYTIETGPPTELRITGMDLPDDVRRALIQLWQDTPVDSLLGDEFTSRLRPWLAEHGYLRADDCHDRQTRGARRRFAARRHHAGSRNTIIAGRCSPATESSASAS